MEIARGVPTYLILPYLTVPFWPKNVGRDMTRVVYL